VGCSYQRRQTCVTLLLTQGNHPNVVSEMLGHANISITLDTYSHVIPGWERLPRTRWRTRRETTDARSPSGA